MKHFTSMIAFVIGSLAGCVDAPTSSDVLDHCGEAPNAPGVTVYFPGDGTASMPAEQYSALDAYHERVVLWRDCVIGLR